MKYVPIRPATWPQDQAQTRQGSASMAAPDLLNFTRRREFYVYSDKLLSYGNLSPPVTNVVPTDADGDFWCTNILARCYTHTQGQQAPNFNLWATIAVKDLRTGEQLFQPNANLLFFEQHDPAAFDPVNTYSTLLNSLVETAFIEPFCFTRDGGISITYETADYAAGVSVVNVDIFLAFIGWKEYEHYAK